MYFFIIHVTFYKRFQVGHTKVLSISSLKKSIVDCFTFPCHVSVEIVPKMNDFNWHHATSRNKQAGARSGVWQQTLATATLSITYLCPLSHAIGRSSVCLSPWSRSTHHSVFARPFSLREPPCLKLRPSRLHLFHRTSPSISVSIVVNTIIPRHRRFLLQVTQSMQAILLYLNLAASRLSPLSFLQAESTFFSNCTQAEPLFAPSHILLAIFIGKFWCEFWFFHQMVILGLE